MKKIIRQDITRCDTSVDSGLTSAQAVARQEAGWSNIAPKQIGKSYLEIFCSNIFTSFNLLCIIMLIAVLSVGAYSDGLFAVIYVLNTIIGIVQECRAKVQVERLNLMATPKAKVIRDSKEVEIDCESIVIDDIVFYKTGDQVTVDGIAMTEGLEVNESLLTGESVPVKKNIGDKLFAGSFISSGSGYIRATEVGADKYIETLTSEARKFKAPKSELFVALKKLIKIITYILIPLGILLAVHNYKLLIAEGIQKVVVQTVGSLVGLIPAGMFLLTSTALAVGVINLAKKQTLVKDLFSIEMLARVDTLCLDKTGTITDGTMRVSEVKAKDEAEVKLALASIIEATGDDNATAKAIREYCKGVSPLKAEVYLPFSSARKLSAVSVGDITYIMGAEEFVLGRTSKEAISYADQGMRVIVVAKVKGTIVDNTLPQGEIERLGIIAISDHIRETARDTIMWFNNSGVDIKIISGDNPLTVSRIAIKVGVKNADKYISLEGMSESEVREAVNNYTIFGRVTPEQKYYIVNELKKQGRTVGMTGDGVNDILAFKEADCSVAMAEGSDAARSVATVVLMNSDFSCMPEVVGEGRRVINNIEKSSSLFIMKNIFTVLFTLFIILIGVPYPITPSKLMLFETFVIGFPSFVLALQPNKALIKGKFLTNVLCQALPYGLLFFLNGVAVYLISPLLGVESQTEDIIVYTMTYIGLVALVNISRPYNLLRICMLMLSILMVIAGFIILPNISLGGSVVLDMGYLNDNALYLAVAIVGLSIPMMYILIEGFGRVFRKLKEKSNLPKNIASGKNK